MLLQHHVELKIFPNVSAHLKLHYFSLPNLQWPKKFGSILGTKVQQTDERAISHVITITSRTVNNISSRSSLFNINNSIILAFQQTSKEIHSDLWIHFTAFLIHSWDLICIKICHTMYHSISSSHSGKQLLCKHTIYYYVYIIIPQLIKHLILLLLIRGPQRRHHVNSHKTC